MFYSWDFGGNLFLWDLFVDVKKPIYREYISGNEIATKWHPNGQKLIYIKD